MARGKQAGGTAREGIVLVDNDPIVLEAIGELLRSKGYETHLARDGLDGLLAVRKLRPTYVLLAIVLPKIDGGRLCSLIRQDPRLRDTLIIAFSSLSPEQIRRFPDLSADAYVAKGPLATVARNILAAIRYAKEKGKGGAEGGIFGYEGFRSHHLMSEMISAKRSYDALMRTLDFGVLQLDEEGRILMANTPACKILGKKESRLIAEKLVSVVPPPDRRVVEETLEELKRDELRETRRVVAFLSKGGVSMRVAAVMDEAQFKGMLVTLETKQPDAMAPQQ
jgi:PAS domain S-box-containing protein